MKLTAHDLVELLSDSDVSYARMMQFLVKARELSIQNDHEVLTVCADRILGDDNDDLAIKLVRQDLSEAFSFWCALTQALKLPLHHRIFLWRDRLWEAGFVLDSDHPVQLVEEIEGLTINVDQSHPRIQIFYGPDRVAFVDFNTMGCWYDQHVAPSASQLRVTQLAGEDLVVEYASGRRWRAGWFDPLSHTGKEAELGFVMRPNPIRRRHQILNDLPPHRRSAVEAILRKPITAPEMRERLFAQALNKDEIDDLIVTRVFWPAF